MLQKAGVTLDTVSQLGYGIYRRGNSIFIFAEKDYIYQEAVLTFLENFLGMVYIRYDLVYYEKDDGSDMWNLPNEDITGEGSPIELRRDPSKWELNIENYYGTGMTLGSEVFIPLRDSHGNQVTAEGGHGDGMFHSSFYYIPPSVYGISNPGYFSTNELYIDENGIQSNVETTQNQLCYTAHGNADDLLAMQTIVAEKIVERALWSYDKNRNVIVFGAQDINIRCGCTSCQAIESKYGTLSAANIIFTNGVAELVKEKLIAEGRSDRAEELVILFFAYQHASTPPYSQYSSELRFSDNVGVFIASSKTEYAFSFDSTQNSKNADEIEGWSQFTNNIYFWLYNYNTSDYLVPVNTFEATRDNINFVIENGAKMVYFESSAENLQSPGFTSFKLYLESQLLCDPTKSYEEIRDTFFDYFYGQGGAQMLSFYNEVVTHMNSKRDAGITDFYGKVVTQNPCKAEYWPLEKLVSWIALCDAALAALDVNDSNYEIYKKNILIEQLFPRWLLARFGQASGEYQKYEGFQGKKYAIGSKTEFKLEKLTEYRLQFAKDCYILGVDYCNSYALVSSYYVAGTYTWNIIDEYNTWAEQNPR